MTKRVSRILLMLLAVIMLGTGAGPAATDAADAQPQRPGLPGDDPLDEPRHPARPGPGSGSAAFGQGYAYAKDRACDLADQIVKVRSERSRWFGRGENDRHVASDFAYQALKITAEARRSLASMPADPRSMIEGYAAGYNAYLKQVGPSGVPGWCRGAPWVRPIAAADLHATHLDLAMMMSGRQLLPAIASAQPPGAARQPEARISPDPGTVRLGVSRLLNGGSAGSNGWAIGAERTANAASRLVANPHFPWEGELKLWESHLTVPGQLDVYGASLGGVPGVVIGFNRRVAWTATIAEGARHTFYALQLADGNPTSYLIDGAREKMRATEAVITVKGADGSLSRVTRTLWSTRYGPVLDLGPMAPELGWTEQRAMTYRDANVHNGKVVEQWLALARSAGVTDVRDAIADVQGIPWTNTMAADDQGRVLYADAAATPNLSTSAVAEWQANPLGILDGSRSANDWQRAAGAREPGLLPFALQPQQVRTDYLANANDSHWIANPAAPTRGLFALAGKGTHGLDTLDRGRTS